MLEINTIADFQALPLEIQTEIQKSVRAKDRLELFLTGLNKRTGQETKPTHQARWEDCSCCRPFWERAGEKGRIYREQSRDDRDIHPSQINKCLKALFYACAGYTDSFEEYVEPRIRMLFDLGSAWHDTMQRYGRMGAWGDPTFYHKETPIDPDARTPEGQPVLPIADRYWIRGSADAVLTRYYLPQVPRVGDVYIRLVHEYKTMNAGQYTKLTRPKPEHKYQATMYSAVFDVPLVVYLYTNKDNSQMADFPVPFDYTIWTEITRKIDAVQYYVNENILPPWEQTAAILNPAECMECGYRRICSPPLTQIGRKVA